MVITYYAGNDTWAGSPGFGTLEISIPAGWTQPQDSNPGQPGYFSVTYSGTSSTAVIGQGALSQTIFIDVSSLPGTTGTITVTYSNATASSNAGLQTFLISTSINGSNIQPIGSSPQVNVIAPTPTITVTNTPIIGDGTASISPIQVAAGVPGNTMKIIYTAGSITWTSSPYGVLSLTIPNGWSQPKYSAVPINDPGYFSVSVTGGTSILTMASGQVITLWVAGLTANTGKITITYGDTSGGGPGATSQPGTGTAQFLVQSAPLGGTPYPIMQSPNVNVIAPTPTFTSTSTWTPTVTITSTSTATPTWTLTNTQTVTPTFTNTPLGTPMPPNGLSVTQNGASTTLQWGNTAMTDYFNIYVATGAYGKFNPFPAGWQVTATVLPTPGVSSSYTYTDTSGSQYTFYLVTGVNGTSEGTPSTMGSKVIMYFNYNSGKTNIYRLAIPYQSKYTHASDFVTEIEGNLTTSTKINQFHLWDPHYQASISYGYSAGFGKWIGTNWAVDAGTSSSNAIYMYAISAFDWIAAGTDNSIGLIFSYNSTLPNSNKRSLPYTSIYKKASDIVADIEGGTGAGTNTKIDMVLKWDPIYQAFIVYGYRPSMSAWGGTNFDIYPGDAVNIYPSGNTAAFTWTPKLVKTPVP